MILLRHTPFLDMRQFDGKARPQRDLNSLHSQTLQNSEIKTSLIFGTTVPEVLYFPFYISTGNGTLDHDEVEAYSYAQTVAPTDHLIPSSLHFRLNFPPYSEQCFF